MRRALAWAVALVLAGWLVCVGLVAAAARRDRAGPADAIVVLGAAQYNGQPSPVLRARLDHAAALWRGGLAPVIIATGGVGDRDTVSEADVARRYLARSGVPDSALLVEGAGRSSVPSLRAAAAQVRARGGQRVVLVSDGFHMARLVVIARRFGLEPLASPAPGSPIRRSLRRELGYILAESVKVPVAFLVTRGS